MEEEKKRVYESKADRFKRIGNKRIMKARVAIKSIGKMADSGYFEFTPEQITLIASTLKNDIMDIVFKFESELTELEKEGEDKGLL